MSLNLQNLKKHKEKKMINEGENYDHFEFGPYAGKRVDEVAKTDPDYLRSLIEPMEDGPVRTSIRRALEEAGHHE